MRYKSVINCVSEEHRKMTLQGSKYVMLVLNQSIKTFVVLTAERVEGLNIFLMM
jgi:hypothetical protein